MKPVLKHRWDLGVAEARNLQERLARRVIVRGRPPAEPLLVCGCDAAGAGRWSRGDETILAAAVVISVPGFELVDSAWVEGPSPFPYVPGLLSFREAPLYVQALRRLKVDPDVIVCDGQGLAHPRLFGLACHIGVLFGKPCVGAAKSRLIGEYDEPGRERGSSTPLRLQGRVVGRVVRTRTGVRPLFVSPGHRLGIEEAASLVLRLATRYRLPEPTRLADRWIRSIRRGETVPPRPMPPAV